MVIQLQASSQFKAGTIAGNKISFAPEVQAVVTTSQLIRIQRGHGHQHS